ARHADARAVLAPVEHGRRRALEPEPDRERVEVERETDDAVRHAPIVVRERTAARSVVRNYDRGVRRPALYGRNRMSANPKWKGARLDDIERRGRDIPVREHMGIRGFGVNAFTPGDDGRLVGEHDEAASGQEELYIVVDGNATFEIDGDTVEAPAGT